MVWAEFKEREIKEKEEHDGWRRTKDTQGGY